MSPMAVVWGVYYAHNVQVTKGFGFLLFGFQNMIMNGHLIPTWYVKGVTRCLVQFTQKLFLGHSSRKRLHSLKTQKWLRLSPHAFSQTPHYTDFFPLGPSYRYASKWVAWSLIDQSRMLGCTATAHWFRWDNGSEDLSFRSGLSGFPVCFHCLCLSWLKSDGSAY